MKETTLTRQRMPWKVADQNDPCGDEHVDKATEKQEVWFVDRLH
jgi:hypothetical protein